MTSYKVMTFQLQECNKARGTSSRFVSLQDDTDETARALVDDAAEGDGAWPLDLTGDGRSELITRSTFGDGMSCVFVYRWNAAEGGSQRSEVDWDKADAQLARLSEPLGVTARAETYHAQDNTVTLTLYTESGTKETTLPLSTDILGEWFAED